MAKLGFCNVFEIQSLNCEIDCGGCGGGGGGGGGGCGGG